MSLFDGCYRQNQTGECLYYIDLEACMLEVIYKFEEDDEADMLMREIIEVSYGFAKMLAEKLFFLDPILFEHYRNMTIAHHAKDQSTVPGSTS